MINVKDQVYAAIKNIAVNVGDTYPTNWAELPAIQYTEEDNSVSVSYTHLTLPTNLRV